jgi:predicted dehydrogenase
MTNKPVVPVLVGRGMAGKAILRSLSIVSQVDHELKLMPVRQVERGAPLRSYLSKEFLNVLFLANPSGLHAQSIIEGVEAGYNSIAVDKPVCVQPGEIALLTSIHAPVAVFHGYRAMWGARTVKSMMESGKLGDVFAFESRYWQSSSALRAMKGTASKESWKDNIRLNGPWDVLTDLGSHVVDLCLYLMAEKPLESRFWISYPNAPARHRDTHVQMRLKFAGGKSSLASISKTVHGAANDFEYTAIGTRGSATWRFQRPDEVEFGSGSEIFLIRREAANPSSETAPFHGLGWLEGYVEITRQTLRQVCGLCFAEIPTLSESLDAMNVILNADIETE